jgi:hypothetical protein
MMGSSGVAFGVTVPAGMLVPFSFLQYTSYTGWLYVRTATQKKPGQVGGTFNLSFPILPPKDWRPQGPKSWQPWRKAVPPEPPKVDPVPKNE